MAADLYDRDRHGAHHHERQRDERAYQERRVRRGQHRDRGDEGEAHREPAHSGRDAA